MARRSKKTLGLDDLGGLALEAPRISYLDKLEERWERNKRHLIHRLIYVGGHYNKDQHAIFATYMEEEVKNAKFGGLDQITGILLVYDAYFIHIVEGTYDQLLTLITICCEQADNDYVSEAMIVLISHDIPFRMFKRWEWMAVRIQRNEELDITKPLEIVKEFLNRLQNLIVFMSTHSLQELHESVDALIESVRESFPSAIAVSCCLQLPLMTATQFINTFRVPQDLVLDDEVVWPLVMNRYQLKL